MSQSAGIRHSYSWSGGEKKMHTDDHRMIRSVSQPEAMGLVREVRQVFT